MLNAHSSLFVGYIYQCNMCNFMSYLCSQREKVSVIVDYISEFSFKGRAKHLKKFERRNVVLPCFLHENYAKRQTWF